MDSDSWLLLILIALICLSAFFSSAETALTTVNRHRIRALADDGSARAKLVLSLTDDMPRLLTSILIGNNIVNLSAFALATVYASHRGGSLAISIGTGVLTLVVLIFGEIAPKTAAALRAEKLSLRFAKPIRAIVVVLTPLYYILQALSNGLLRLFRVDPHEKPDVITEEELRTVVEVSHEEGVIESEEKEMINNVVDLGDTQAKDIMIPRVDVVFADVDSTYDEILRIFSKERYTRLPVYEDSPDTIIGILNMKDLLLCRPGEPFSIRSLMRKPHFTHEFKNVSELFLEMREETIPISIVLDEYGTTVGIITMEDIVEEIVGDIRDEYDTNELNDIQRLSDRVWLIEGSENLDDVNDALGTAFESEDYDSVGGYFLGLLDHFPKKNESAKDASGCIFVAARVDGNRIEKIKLIFPEKEKNEEFDNEYGPDE